MNHFFRNVFCCCKSPLNLGNPITATKRRSTPEDRFANRRPLTGCHHSGAVFLVLTNIWKRAASIPYQMSFVNNSTPGSNGLTAESLKANLAQNPPSKSPKLLHRNRCPAKSSTRKCTYTALGLALILPLQALITGWLLTFRRLQTQARS